MKTYLQNGSENRQFSKGRPFTSRGLLIPKSVFLTGRVLRDVSMFLQNWLIRWFQLIADALTVPPKNRVPGASTQWRNWSKIRRRRRTYKRTHKFKRRPHKSPSGNNNVFVSWLNNRRLQLRDDYQYHWSVCCCDETPTYIQLNWFQQT